MSHTCKVLPLAVNLRHLGLTAEFTFSANLSGDFADFKCKCVQSIHHGIDCIL
jgi:hypothetical protein